MQRLRNRSSSKLGRRRSCRNEAQPIVQSARRQERLQEIDKEAVNAEAKAAEVEKSSEAERSEAIRNALDAQQ